MPTGRLLVDNIVPSVFPANMDRSSVLFVQNGLIPIRIGLDLTTPVTDWIPLSPCEVDGGGMIIYGTGGSWSVDDCARNIYLLAVGAPGEVIYAEMIHYWLNTATGDIYGPKVGGAWGPIVLNIIGAPGAAGNTVLYGAGAPGGGTGVNGNFYIDTATSFIYGPKAGGAWPAGVSMIGAPGAAGNAVLNGVVPPAAGDGVNGDFWLDTVTHLFYGPKAGGAWPAGALLPGLAQALATTGSAVDVAASAPGVAGDVLQLDSPTAASYHPITGKILMFSAGNWFP
jgi:hypothetical protein